jgi:hypothetical protein
MVSMRDTKVYTGSGLRGVIPYVQSRVIMFLCKEVCSRGYKLVRRGCRVQVPVGVEMINLSASMMFALLSLFIDARVMGIQMCSIVLGSWEVFSHVGVRQEALKGAELWWSLQLPRVWATLYIQSTWHLLRALS